MSEFFRRCTFCGKPPSKKSKEHVIPRWLSKWSERAKAPADGFHKTALLYEAIVSPAFKDCNELWGNVEGKVKSIFNNIENTRRIRFWEADLLLDWLDKQRMILWLHQKQFQRKHYPMPPKFFVNARVGAADRAVTIGVLPKTVGKGIEIIGVNHPNFMLMPSAFGLIVKNIAIISWSHPALLMIMLGLAQVSKFNISARALDSPNLAIKMTGETLSIPPPLGIGSDAITIGQMHSIPAKRVLAAGDKRVINRIINLPFLFYDTGNQKQDIDSHILIPEAVLPDKASLNMWRADTLHVQRNVSNLFRLRFGVSQNAFYVEDQILTSFANEFYRLAADGAGHASSTDKRLNI